MRHGSSLLPRLVLFQSGACLRRGAARRLRHHQFRRGQYPQIVGGQDLRVDRRRSDGGRRAAPPLGVEIYRAGHLRRRTCVACQDLRPARSVVADVSGCQECDRYQGLQSRHAVRRDFPRRGRKLFGIGLGVAVHGHRRAARDQRSGQPVLSGAGLPRFGYEQSGLGLAHGRPVDRRRVRRGRSAPRRDAALLLDPFEAVACDRSGDR